MMTRLARNLLLGLLLWFAALGTATAEGSAQPRAHDESQQVLVLLRLPAAHFAPDASYAGGYDDGAGLAARKRIARRLARQHGLTLVDGWPMPLIGVDCFIMAVPGNHSPADAARDLAADPEVAWSEPMRIYRGQGKAPNDPLYALQPAAREWRLTDLHAIATGRNVRVAVVDSMVDARHPDLAGQVEVSQNFVADHPGGPEEHGTGVAGIIAALPDNGVGMSGIAPGARLMALRACWQQPGAAGTICDTLSLAKALHFAIEHDAQIINLSLGGPQDQLLGRLLDVALARHVIVVAAVDPGQPDGGFPASHPGVVAVTDDPREGGLAGALLAPGRDVPTTEPGGRWSLVNGSSYSAAHVSGLFALLREHSPHGQGSAGLVLVRSGGGGIDACASLLGATRPCDGCACGQPAKYPAIVRR
jgi:hypothetical protein